MGHFSAPTEDATQPHRAGRQGFTLVELSVVIAVITVLVAILMPTLKEGMETARRVACARNLNGIVVCIQLYTADWGGRLPQSEGNYRYPCRYYCEYAADYAVLPDRLTSANHYARNAWAVLVDHGYVPLPLTRCPAFQPKLWHSGFVKSEDGWAGSWKRDSYMYRHNFAPSNTCNNLVPLTVTFSPVPLYFQMPSWNVKAILADDADHGLNNTGDIWNDVYAKKVNPRNWAHPSGGNVARHDASVKFVTNFWDYVPIAQTSPDTWPNYYRGWPTYYLFGAWNLLDQQL